MTFDISKLDCATPADEGRDMELLLPDGSVAKHDDGRAVTITLRGRFSRAVRAAEREIASKRLENQRRGRLTSIEDSEAEVTELLVAATKNWSFDAMDGQPFPCSSENARRFWTDDRFALFRMQGEMFINSDARFMKR